MITKAQKHAFQQDGFVVFPKLLAGDDLAELDAMCDAVLDGKLAPVTPFEGWLPDHFYTFWEPGLQDRDDLPRRQRVRLMSNMCRHHPYFHAIVRHPRIVTALQGLLDDDVMVRSDTIFMKPAHHGIEAALHQDTAFYPRTKPNTLIFWMAIDEATEANGCLHVIPGSHKSRLPHRDDLVQGHVLDDDQVEIDRQIALTCEPGDAIVADAGIAHRSYPNRSADSRRAYTITSAPAKMQYIEPWKVTTISEKTPQYEFELIG